MFHNVSTRSSAARYDNKLPLSKVGVHVVVKMKNQLQARRPNQSKNMTTLLSFFRWLEGKMQKGKV